MNRSALAFVSLIALIGLTACETVKGVGRDIEGAGEAVTDTAEDVEG